MRRARTRKNGFTIGELLLVFFFVFVIILLFQPLVRFIERKKDKVICANNVRELGRALYIYARENNGKFPETLKELYDEEYLADPRFLDCPASERKGTPETPDYKYNSGLTVESLSRIVLVEDQDGNHKSGKNVLTVNGTVFWQDK